MEGSYKMVLVSSRGRIEKKGSLANLVEEAEYYDNVLSLSIQKEVIEDGEETVQKEEEKENESSILWQCLQSSSLASFVDCS